MSISKIVIADSHEVVREGIAHGLSSVDGAMVTGLVGDGYAAIKACRQNQCDILLIDLSITRPSGPEVLARLRNACQEVKVIVMSSDTTLSVAMFALSQGAIGFVPKQAGGKEFINAVTAAQGGYAYMPVSFLTWMVEARQKLSRTGNMFGLSPREVDILEASVNGGSIKEVAQQFSISIRTVETHRNNIYRKTECSNAAELARVAASLNLLDHSATSASN
ncbi:MAG: response regulator transcription factor [Pseudomonadota bacterium]